MIDTNHLIIIVISLILSAFFSGVEIAFIASDKLAIELSKAQGSIQGKILSGFVKRPSWFISTTLLGNNITLVLYGIFMAFILEPLIIQWLPEFLNTNLIVFATQTITATLIVLVTAEFMPKSIFLLNPNRMLSFFAIPIYTFYLILFPAVALIVFLSKFLIEKILRLEYSEDQPVFGLTDLNQYVQMMTSRQTKHQIAEVDTRIFTNALEFKAVKVRECLVPRAELITVDIQDSIEDLKKAFIESGYSKIPVYKESIDDVVGYCNYLELFKKPQAIADIVNPIIIVPETMQANELLVQFITEGKSIALVVDEFGGTSGIVTVEDIIEEIFGEIEDEHDEQDLIEKELNESNYLLSARHEIDYLNEKYGWELPLGDYDTLGGLLLSIVEDLPKVNDVIELLPFTFTIDSIDHNRIDQVRITIHDS